MKNDNLSKIDRRGGRRPNSGRKKMFDQDEVLDRVRRVQGKWWTLVEQFLDSRNKKDRMFAISEINKLQVKLLPTALTGGNGGPVQLIWKSSSITPPDGGPNNSTPPQAAG
jgi:hypothetical protein